MNKRRILVYILFLLVIVFAVATRQKVVVARRNKKIYSTFSEWKEQGKPVFIKEIQKEDVKTFTKLTVVPISGQEYESYVPKSIQKKLASGQDVFLKGSTDEVIGKVVLVSDVIDLKTGMFYVKLISNERINSGRERLVVYVNTGLFRDVLCVPSEIVKTEENGSLFLWIVEKNKAQKKTVKIRERDGYGSIISQGLNVGDKIIVSGFSKVSEGDNLNILDAQLSEEI